MNERIAKLAMQANSHHDNFFDLNYKELDVFLEKFAELIVRECVTTLERHHPFTKDPEAYLYAISLIEEHFGVET